MKRRMPLIFWVLLLSPVLIWAQDNYQYSVDIASIKNDQVAVELITPTIKNDTAVFSFPKAIPGSYAVKDFGRFIKELKAFDQAGKRLQVQKLNNNQYQIAKAKSLRRIKYFVDDTWDTNHSNFIFQPSGTNIEEGRNVVMNNHAFFAYFEGYKSLPFQITVTKPAQFYASTHLNVKAVSAKKDMISSPNYNHLADNPVLYSVPDTTSFKVGQTVINVSVFSESAKVNSKQIATYLQPLSAALSAFFNGLPVNSYQFLFYFTDPEKSLGSEEGGGGFGALEHNYSSLYYLPEMAMESRLRSMVNEVSGHEFLHILTPLNLHSSEIEDFDFINPVMSQHLWLYEGVTEYFAHLVQLQSGLYDQKEFFSNMKEKMKQAEAFGAFSMTEMSKNVLTDAYKEKYNSVYSKGALIGFMLDLYIRQKTNNAKDLKSVVQTLASRFGPNRPFVDTTFFSELINASHPGVATFINQYIVGSQPLPYKELLATIGYDFDNDKAKTAYSIGDRLSLIYNEPNKQFVFDKVGSNALAIRNNDVLISINNIALTDENLNELWERYIQANYTQPELVMTVKRAGVEQQLQGKLFRGRTTVKNYLAPMEQPTFQQQNNLKRLLGDKVSGSLGQ